MYQTQYSRRGAEKDCIERDSGIYSTFIDYQMIMEELCEMQVSYDQVIGYDTQISKLQEEYNRYYSLKASLGDDLKEGLISKAEFDDFRESYGRKCEELEQMIENQKSW